MTTNSDLPPLVGAWRATAVGLTTAGCLMLILVPEPLQVMSNMAVVATLVAIGIGCARTEAEPPPGRLVLLLARDWLCATAVGLGFYGWAGVTGPIAVLVVLGMACWSPPVVRRLGVDHSRVPVPDARTHERVDGPPPLLVQLDLDRIAAMTIEELLKEGRRSARLVASAPDPTTRNRLVLLRERYLDELSRRDPGLVRAWRESRGADDGMPPSG